MMAWVAGALTEFPAPGLGPRPTPAGTGIEEVSQHMEALSPSPFLKEVYIFHEHLKILFVYLRSGELERQVSIYWFTPPNACNEQGYSKELGMQFRSALCVCGRNAGTWANPAASQSLRKQGVATWSCSQESNPDIVMKGVGG